MFQLKEYQRRCVDELAEYFRQSGAFGVRRALAALALALAGEEALRMFGGMPAGSWGVVFSRLLAKSCQSGEGSPHSKGQAFFDACWSCGDPAVFALSPRWGSFARETGSGGLTPPRKGPQGPAKSCRPVEPGSDGKQRGHWRFEI